jgi:hypothetical protein
MGSAKLKAQLQQCSDCMLLHARQPHTSAHDAVGYDIYKGAADGMIEPAQQEGPARDEIYAHSVSLK